MLNQGHISHSQLPQMGCKFCIQKEGAGFQQLEMLIFPYHRESRTRCCLPPFQADIIYTSAKPLNVSL